MERVESIKKVSRIIGAIGNVFQIMFGVMTGLMLLSCGILFVLRNELNGMIAEDHVYFDFHLMGGQAQKLADEGKVTEAFVVFALSMILFSLVVTVIMHFITKIFKRFCHNYSPFLPEVVRDIKILAILITLLVLSKSIGLGIILGFVFWGILQIYEYGCELQNQADETL